MKYVIYRHEGILHLTTETNYKAGNNNPEVITCLKHYKTPADVIRYYGPCYNLEPKDFLVVRGGNLVSGILYARA